MEEERDPVDLYWIAVRDEQVLEIMGGLLSQAPPQTKEERDAHKEVRDALYRLNILVWKRKDAAEKEVRKGKE